MGAGRGAGREAGLKAGASVSVVVRERTGPGLYLVAIGHRLLSASSASALEPGTILKARVERSGDAILLRLAADPHREADFARALSAAGLPNDAAGRAALAALLREGLAPSPRALARVRRAALQDDSDAGELTDLAAKMEAKGLPAEGPALGCLADLSRGGGGSAGGGGQDGRGKGGASDGETLVPEGELPRVLGSLLRSLVAGIGGAEAGGEGETLALFNHLRGPEGSWVLVPFRFSLDAVDFSGCFRIQLPYVRGGQGLFQAVFTASRGAAPEDWSLSLDFGGGRAPTLDIAGPDGRAAVCRARLGELAAALAPHSCSVGLSPRRAASRGGAPGASAEGLDLDA